jgi:hypothetical protein
MDKAPLNPAPLRAKTLKMQQKRKINPTEPDLA